MDMTIVNENDVTEVKTGRGYTKVPGDQQTRRGRQHHDPHLGPGH